MSLEYSPIGDDWRWDNKHWHAYTHQPGESGVREQDRHDRLHRWPDTVLTTPTDVADWIEAQYAQHAPDTQPDSSTQELDVYHEMSERASYRWRTNAVLASRGESLYIEVKNIGYRPARNTPPCRDLYVEALTPDVCVCTNGAGPT